MVPIENLSILKAEDAEPGTLLVGHARRQREPAFTSMLDGSPAVFKFAERDVHGFSLTKVENGLGYWVCAGKPILAVDHLSVVNLHKHDVPIGSLVITDGEPAFACSMSFATVYVTLDGKIHKDISLESLCVFSKWKMYISAFEDEHLLIYEADVTPGS